MIKSYACKETKKLWETGQCKDFRAFQKQALIKLSVLNAATSLSCLRTPPSNRLEALKGNRKGQFSIRINRQWRLCFTWRNNDAEEIEIVDYH